MIASLTVQGRVTEQTAQLIDLEGLRLTLARPLPTIYIGAYVVIIAQVISVQSHALYADVLSIAPLSRDQDDQPGSLPTAQSQRDPMAPHDASLAQRGDACRPGNGAEPPCTPATSPSAGFAFGNAPQPKPVTGPNKPVSTNVSQFTFDAPPVASVPNPGPNAASPQTTMVYNQPPAANTPSRDSLLAQQQARMQQFRELARQSDEQFLDIPY